MEEVIDADRVVILDHGHIVENDSPANLKNKYTVPKLYWYTDFNEKNLGLLKNFENKYEVDHFIVKMEHNEIRDFIYKNKINDFEVYKGSMDDVFINLTGKELK